MILNLHLVRVFYHVIQCNSFSEAANKLYISQSAVSKAVKELETQLNLPLIERRHKNKTIVLTENGQALFTHARGIFALEQAAVDDLQNRLGLKKGHLVIGASTTIASYWLPDYIAQFQKHYPDINIHLQVGNTETISQLLVDCDIDFAFVEGKIAHERINSTDWQTEELQLICSTDKHLTIDQLDKQLWIMREAGSGTYNITIEVLEQLNINPNHYLTLASNEGIARLVAKGTGIAILPRCIVEDLIHLNQLKTIKHSKLQRTLYLLELKDRPLSPLATAFIKLCLPLRK